MPSDPFCRLLANISNYKCACLITRRFEPVHLEQSDNKSNSSICCFLGVLLLQFGVVVVVVVFSFVLLGILLLLVVSCLVFCLFFVFFCLVGWVFCFVSLFLFVLLLLGWGCFGVVVLLLLLLLLFCFCFCFFACWQTSSHAATPQRKLQMKLTISSRYIALKTGAYIYLLASEFFFLRDIGDHWRLESLKM